MSMYNCVLLRYGEIGLKSNRTRPIFERLYVTSIKDALTRNYFENFDIINMGGRFVVYCEQAVEAVHVLKKVPGIQGVSPALRIKFSGKEDLIKQISEKATLLVKGKTFGVKVKRVGKHDFVSMDLAKEVADDIYDSSAGVDLKNPDTWIFLEVRDNECFFYTETIKAVGGLPSGSSDKVLCLFSGGIDSPVAAFEMMKRGCKVDFLFINIVGDKLLNDVAKIYNYLIANFTFGYIPKMYVVDAKKIVDKIIKDVPDDLRQIAYKIVLYKIGELVKDRHLALVSGESLAQKSSQTLRSLLFIEKQVSVSMLRPLLTFDKIDIMELARRLGTLSLSEKIKEYCGLSDGAVTTCPRTSDLEKMPLDEELIKKACENVNIFEGAIPIKESAPPKITTKITSVDIRGSMAQKNIPIKTDLSIPYSEIFNRLDEFEKGKTYLFVCKFGVKSEDVAFELEKKGVKAVGVSTDNFLKYFSKK